MVVLVSSQDFNYKIVMHLVDHLLKDMPSKGSKPYASNVELRGYIF